MQRFSQTFCPEHPHNVDVLQIFRKTNRMLCTPQMIANADLYPIAPEDLKTLKATEEWVRPVMTKKVTKARGKIEAVCPFVPPALDRELLFLSVAKPAQPDSVQDVYREMKVYQEIFKSFGPQKSPLSLLKSLVVIFPETPGDVMLDTVNPDHTRLKTELLENRIMIGEFFPGCPLPASWDSTFFPLQSPIPFYALRSFVETDWRFVHSVREWRKIYKARFGEPPQGDRQKIPRRLARFLSKVTKAKF